MNSSSSNFNDIAPRTRSTRATMKDKESIENRRLQQRVGNFHQYVDSAEIFRPDPVSTHFISEAERFDKDFNVADQVVRQKTFETKQTKITNLRQERLQRENNRFGAMEAHEKFQHDRINVRRDMYQAGKKNKGGSAFNIVTLNYDNNPDGKRLKQVDNDAEVRALMRSKVLDKKNNGEYNILTGVQRPPVPVPHHDRYNPIGSAGRQMMSS